MTPVKTIREDLLAVLALSGIEKISFDNMEGGMNRMYDIRGFEIAGEDRVFHKADAVPEGNRLRLSSPEVPAPVAVRYAFHNWPEANFGNGLGLPLFPFRSDDW